jgi:hypothetical protein
MTTPPISPKSHLPFEFKLPKFPDPLFGSPSSRDSTINRTIASSKNGIDARERISSHPRSHAKLEFFTSVTRRDYQLFDQSLNMLQVKQMYTNEDSLELSKIKAKSSISPEPIRYSSKQSPIKKSFITPTKAKPNNHQQRIYEELHKENLHLKEQLKKINDQLSKVIESSSNL